MEGKTISSCRSGNLGPSSTARTNDHLLDVKGLKLRRDVDLSVPRAVNDVWQELMEEVFAIPSDDPRSTLQPADIKAFAAVINQDHGAEKGFDQGLFLALRQCLTRRQLVRVDNNDSKPKKSARDAIARVIHAISPLKKKSTSVPPQTGQDHDDADETPKVQRVLLNEDEGQVSPTLSGGAHRGYKSESKSEIEPTIQTGEDHGRNATYESNSLLLVKPKVLNFDESVSLVAEEDSTMRRSVGFKNEATNRLSPIGSVLGKLASPEANEEVQEIALRPIVFNLPGEGTDYPMYAIGIARQANGERGSSSGGSTGSGLAAGSRLDHCSYLLEKEALGSDWTVVKCFSVMELKVGTDGVAATVTGNKVVDLQLESANGAIAQALAYTLGWVLPSHASLGERLCDLEELCWGLIIGRKKVDSKTSKFRPAALGMKLRKVGSKRATMGTITEDKATKAEEEQQLVEALDDRMQKMNISSAAGGKYRWMSGKIYVPEKCGRTFEYSATGCGNLNVYEVLSVYLDTLLFGLRAAKTLMEAIGLNIKIVPRPSSGRRVEFGEVTLLVQLKAKTKVGKRLRSDPDDDGNWMLSQGEIFTGKVNFGTLKNLCVESGLGKNEFVKRFAGAKTATLVGMRSKFKKQEGKNNLMIFNEDSVDVEVVVKVSSLSVHKYLNHPSNAGAALRKIQSEYFEPISGNQPKLGLFNVLYAAEVMPNALITIMANLSPDYKVLTPQNDNMTFVMVWTAFHDLVLNILFPLAEIGVIHPDIRPGWNFTSNILYSRSKKPAMQIIDFDSLVLHSSWSPPDKGWKYISEDKAVTPYRFLWWQCVTLAYAWYTEKSQVQMETINMVEVLRDPTNAFSTILGNDFCDAANERDLGDLDFLACFTHMSFVLAKITTP